MPRRIRTFLILLAAISCRPAGESQPATDSSAPEVSQAAHTFDPATVRAGAAVAGLVLDSINQQRKSVVIDRFTVYRNLSDAVNSARLVEVAPGTP